MKDFSRQSFLGPDAQTILEGTRVAIVGLGGGGSHIAQQLAHIGVGEIRLIDPDAIEASNLNRLVGATSLDVEKATAKVDIAHRMIKAVRPWIKVVSAKSKWQEVDHLIRDGHVVFGCLDGYQQRDYLEIAARRFGIPYIDIGMDVTKIGPQSFAVAGQMIMTLPGGPCMRCLGFITDARVNAEENRYGDAGINPQVIWTNGTLASLAVGAFMRMFTPWYPIAQSYEWLELDGNTQTVTPSRQPLYVPKHDRCPHRNGSEDIGDPFFSLAYA